MKFAYLVGEDVYAVTSSWENAFEIIKKNYRKASVRDENDRSEIELTEREIREALPCVDDEFGFDLITENTTYVTFLNIPVQRVPFHG